MTDRYLFRGKRVDNGEWVVGGYLPLIKTGFDDGRGYIWENQYKCMCQKVDPSTIGQCTGLRDKNGTLIFEGDVVRFKHPSSDVQNGSGVVIWSEDELAWEFRDQAPDSLEWYNGYAGDLYEIIGNIHDNPELLGKED